MEAHSAARLARDQGMERAATSAERIDYAKAHELLAYDPETRRLTWKKSTNNVKAGHEVGGIDHHGYRVFKYEGKKYSAHRIAYLMHHGTMPEQIDHIDRDRANNRINNLRPADNSQNQCNRGMAVNNSSGYKNVSFHKSKGKWRATIKIRGRQVHLGYFTTPEEAFGAYTSRAADFHGQYANTAEAA